jgi:hypothetical protein
MRFVTQDGEKNTVQFGGLEPGKCIRLYLLDLDQSEIQLVVDGIMSTRVPNRLLVFDTGSASVVSGDEVQPGQIVLKSSSGNGISFPGGIEDDEIGIAFAFVD